MKIPPFVSVVIPVYNEEKYISQCIESVLSQSYTNYECIIVDNKSTDSSYDIIKYYEKLDKRIIVHSNDIYLPMLKNHNKSLKYISPLSKYCKMVLGDDFIFHDCIEKMVELAESDSTIGIVCSLRMLGNDVAGLGLPVADNPKGYSVFNGKKICKFQLLNGGVYLFGGQTAVMYKSDAVRNRDPFFNESSLFPDTEICYEFLKEHNFGYINQVLSYTRTDNNSFMSSIQDYRPGLVLKIEFLYKFGNYYLDSLEYQNRYNEIFKEYYDYLGWKFITRRKRQFWRFHENQLGIIGFKIKKSLIYMHAIKYLLDLILNPKRTSEYIINKYSKRKSVNNEIIPNLYVIP